VTGRPVDASMTLITSMMQRPLDPGYAAAAQRRGEAGLPPATSVRTRTMLVAAVVTGLLLTVAAQSLRGRETTAARARAELVEQIESRRGVADRQARAVQELQAQISQAQARSLGAQRQGALARELTVLETAAGGSAVAGPGLRIVLDDAPSALSDRSGSDPRSGPAADEGRVLARDLQMVTNGLWEAGAEAVAVNGQRLTARSAIRFAGEAILVNFRPLTRPYTVTAIGSPDRLGTGFADSAGGSYARALQENYGIGVRIETKERLTIPSATSVSVRNAVVPRAASRGARSIQPTTATASEPAQ
jgi:uncharacterized protein YlxW (UPF0749 family)